MIEYRRGFNQLLAQQFFYRIMQRDKSPGDAGCACTAIGLDDIAIDLDSALAQFCQIHY